MRTFIAIELPAIVRAQVTLLQNQLRAQLRTHHIANCFSWTAPEKIHLTLRFLGETTEAQCAQLAQGLAPIVAQQPPMHLALQGMGCFPNFRSPNVLWLGISGALAELGRLQMQVEHLAQASGFAAERRPFAPHLTIARVQRNVDHVQQRKAGEALRLFTQHPVAPSNMHGATEFNVGELVHMQSELRPEGARYTPLHHFVFMQ